MSPAKNVRVEISEEEKTAHVFVPVEELSLAIGRDGQNVRLASKLTGYRIEIEGEEVKSEVTAQPQVIEEVKEDKEEKPAVEVSEKVEDENPPTPKVSEDKEVTADEPKS